MKELFIGINNRFATTSASSFRNAIGSRLYFEYANQNTQYPYAVYGMVNNSHDWQFNSDYEDVIIDFNLYADNESEAATLRNKLVEAYDDCQFTVSNYSLLKFRRENEIISVEPNVLPNKNIWQYTVQYSVLLRKST